MNEKLKKVIDALPEMDKHILMWAMWIGMSPQAERILGILKKMPEEEAKMLLSWKWSEDESWEMPEAKEPMMPPHVEKMKMLMGKIAPEHKDYLMK